MATVYRFCWAGCDSSVIRQNLSPKVDYVLTGAVPEAFVDVTLEPGPPGSDAESDLNAAMTSMGWMAMAIDPATPLRALVTKQEIELDLSEDTETSSEKWQSLLEIPFTTDDGTLDVRVTLSALTTAPAYLTLELDDVQLANGGTTLATGASSAALMKRLDVKAGDHVLRLLWRMSLPLSSAAIRPVKNPDGEHASLYVREVAS